MERQDAKPETTELTADEWRFLEVRAGQRVRTDLDYVSEQLEIPLKEARVIDKRISNKLAKAYLLRLYPFEDRI